MRSRRWISPIPGRAGAIADIPVPQGAPRREGETIATLEPYDYEIATSARRSGNTISRSATSKRKRELVARESISTAAFEQSKIEYRLRRVALDNAERNRDHTTIAAPFDALVTRRIADPYANVQAGTPIVRVQDVTELRVHINVPVSVIGLVSNPDMFRIEAVFPDRPDEPLPLTYREHATEPDAIAQTYEVTLALDVPFDGTILPGMTVSVRVSLAAARAQEMMTLPVSPIRYGSRGDFRIWVIRSGYPRRWPPRGSRSAMWWRNRIAGGWTGWAPSEAVVAAGAHLMREGHARAPLRELLRGHPYGYRARGPSQAGQYLDHRADLPARRDLGALTVGTAENPSFTIKQAWCSP